MVGQVASGFRATARGPQAESESAQFLIHRGELVGAALFGRRGEGLSGCDDKTFRERVDRLIACVAISERIKPIVSRWKIPIRFDPQSLIVQKAVEWRLDVESEEGFARCLREVAATNIGDIGVTAGNIKGQDRLQVFTKFHSAFGIDSPRQRWEELSWIAEEARKAELPADLLEELQTKLRREEENLKKAGVPPRVCGFFGGVMKGAGQGLPRTCQNHRYLQCLAYLHIKAQTSLRVIRSALDGKRETG